MTRLASLLVIGLSLLPSAAAAQDLSQVRAGALVRVWTSPTSAPLLGNVVWQDGTSLTLKAKGFEQPVSVTRNTITRIDVSRGRRSRGKSVLYGVAIGVGSALVLGVAAGDDPPNSFLAFTAMQKALVFNILTVPVGALVGAIVGPGPERWTTTTASSKGTHLSVPPSPSLRLTLRF